MAPSRRHSANFWRRHLSDNSVPDPAAAAEQRPVRRPLTAPGITPEVLAKSHYRTRPSLDGPPANPFQFPRFPPQVERAVSAAGHKLLAEDQEFSGAFGWAASDPMYVQYSEGVAFLGYSYLATLAQRAEYRVVTETIAAELCREWVELKVASDDDTKNDLKKRIEDRMDELKVQDCFRQVAEGDGFFGRAHLYLDTGKTDDAEELIKDLGNGRSAMSRLKVGPNKNQKLIRLQPVEATWVYPTFYESVDPLKRDWYNPVTWYVMSREIHRSRLLTFIGRPVPDLLKPAYSFGGLAMTQMLKPYVENWLRTRQAVSDCIQAFSFNVLRTNLDATTGTGGEALFGRIALFNNIRNNQGTICLRSDSIINCNRGPVPICEVKLADKVMTRNGWAPLVFAGITGYATELIEITTSRSTLWATACHPIYTTNGFVAAQFVKPGDRLLAAPTKGQTSTAKGFCGAVIGGLRTSMAITGTRREASNFCTGLFGKLTSVPSRRDIISITLMEIQRTINSVIWSLLPLRSINGFIGRTMFPVMAFASNAGVNSRQSAHARSSIAVCSARTASSTARRAAAKASCSWVKRIMSRVWDAARGLSLPWGLDRRQNTAARDAVNEWPTVTSVRSVKLATPLPVYNLEVAPGHLPEFYANGILVHNCIDKDSEDWSNVSIPVGSLDHLQAQSQEHMAAISRIPLVKLLGIQPAGLNATSEGELIAFEDWIAGFQEVLFRDHLRTVIDLIQLSMFGNIDEDIDFEFKPLRQLKPLEEAQLESVIAQTREGYLQMGAVSAEEVREQLAQDKETPFSGLDLDQPLPAPPGMPPGMGGPGPIGMPGEGPPGAPGSPPGGQGGQRPGLPPLPKPPRPPQPGSRPMDGFPTDTYYDGYDEGTEVIPVDQEVFDMLAGDETPEPRLRRPTR